MSKIMVIQVIEEVEVELIQASKIKEEVKLLFREVSDNKLNNKSDDKLKEVEINFTTSTTISLIPFIDTHKDRIESMLRNSFREADILKVRY